MKRNVNDPKHNVEDKNKNAAGKKASPSKRETEMHASDKQSKTTKKK